MQPDGSLPHSQKPIVCPYYTYILEILVKWRFVGAELLRKCVKQQSHVAQSTIRLPGHLPVPDPVIMPGLCVYIWTLDLPVRSRSSKHLTATFGGCPEDGGSRSFRNIRYRLADYRGTMSNTTSALLHLKHNLPHFSLHNYEGLPVIKQGCDLKTPCSGWH
jgi:hypothetical protein